MLHYTILIPSILGLCTTSGPGGGFCMKNKVAVRRSVSGIALSVLLLFTAGAPMASSQQSTEAMSAPELVTADSARVTPGGATFKVPAGWSMATGKDLVVLTPPEPD